MMKTEKQVVILHADGAVSCTLRRLLRAQGCDVATRLSCQDLLDSVVPLHPDLILLDLDLFNHEGPALLSRIMRKWNETEIVLLPEGLGKKSDPSFTITQLQGIVGRFLEMRTMRDLLAV